MSKETIIGYTSAAILSVAFITISVLYFFFPNSHKLLRSKLQIGALIIGFTTISTTFSSCCYAPSDPDPNNIRIDNLMSGKIVVNYQNSYIISGSIESPSYSTYFYSINKNDSIYLADNIYPADSVYNDYYEDFTITITDSLEIGEYMFHCYHTTVSNSNIILSLPLTVNNIKYE